MKSGAPSPRIPPDLGCGQDWETAWKARPAAPLTCDECGHRMHAKVSRHGHAVLRPRTGRTQLHPRAGIGRPSPLEARAANAARAAGVDAEMEVRGPDGTWRADVMASGPVGAWRMALEAQLAPITAVDITARTNRMRADDVPSIWFSDRPCPTLAWCRAIRPSHPGTTTARAWRRLIAAGLEKFDRLPWQAVPAQPAPVP